MLKNKVIMFAAVVAMAALTAQAVEDGKGTNVVKNLRVVPNGTLSLGEVAITNWTLLPVGTGAVSLVNFVGWSNAVQGATNILNSATNALQVQAAALQGATGILNSATNALQIQAAALQGATGILNSATNALQVQAKALQDATNALQVQATALQGATNILNSATNALQVQAKALQDATNALQVQATALQGATNILNSATNALQVQAKALQDATNSLNNTKINRVGDTGTTFTVTGSFYQDQGPNQTFGTVGQEISPFGGPYIVVTGSVANVTVSIAVGASLPDGAGQTIILQGGAGNAVTLTNGGRVALNDGVNFTFATNNTMQLIWNGTTWTEISRVAP